MLQRIIVLLMVSLLLMIPAALVAQDDFLVYVSDTEIFRIEHPEGWFVSDQVAEQATIIIGNSPRFVDRVSEDFDISPESGEQAAVLFLIPTDLLPAIDVIVTPDTTPPEFIEAISESILASGEEQFVFDEAEIISFDERDIGIIPFEESELNAEGYFLAWQHDSVTIIALVIAHSGEVAAFEDLAFDMLASFELMVSGDELLDRMNP